MKSIVFLSLVLNCGYSGFAQDTSITKDTTPIIFIDDFKMPHPLMGMDSFLKLRDSSMVYPKSDFENGIEGKVYLRFIIGLDSNLHKIEMWPDSQHIATPGMVEESIRLLKLSGRWMPASQFGWPVESRYVMPFRFSIDKHQKAPVKKRKWWWRN